MYAFTGVQTGSGRTGSHDVVSYHMSCPSRLNIRRFLGGPC